MICYTFTSFTTNFRYGTFTFFNLLLPHFPSCSWWYFYTKFFKAISWATEQHASPSEAQFTLYLLSLCYNCNCWQFISRQIAYTSRPARTHRIHDTRAKGFIDPSSSFGLLSCHINATLCAYRRGLDNHGWYVYICSALISPIIWWEKFISSASELQCW